MLPLGRSLENVSHLYRHLLREASYLPPICQSYISGQIKAHFRRHRTEPEPARYLRKARHDFRYLRAANAGDMVRMKRILLLSFGRIGQRRRELVTQLLAKEPPANTAALESKSEETQAAALGRKPDWLDNWDLEKLRAYLKSQASTPFRESPRPEINPSKLDPSKDIPALNSWRKPWKENVLRTKQKKWWKLMVNRVLPPLPKGEWEMLRDLADGSLAGPAWDAPPRRFAARPILAEDDGESAVTSNWMPYALLPARTIERKHSRSAQSMNIEPSAELCSDAGAAIGVHKTTPRYWRRMYGHLWHTTAIMEKQAKDGDKLRITWGRPEVTLPSPSGEQLEFFEGVGTDGKRTDAKSATLPKAG